MQLALSQYNVNPLRKLYNKLSRELAQSEHSAIVHARREARRLGDTPPARALRALAGHALALEPRFDSVFKIRVPLGALAGRKVGKLFSVLRHVLFDRLIDVERSYRATLLGFHHGVDCARLLRDVAERLDERDAVAYCDDMLARRVPLLEAAHRELAWFAERPRKAIQSGLRIAFESSRE
jgi:hypothetical protein